MRRQEIKRKDFRLQPYARRVGVPACLQSMTRRATFTLMLAPDSLIGNRYRVVRPIGEGGMGAVYEAFDQRLRSRVALKQTLFNQTQYTDAFEHEAQLLANLRHPALPKVSDYFSDPEGQFLVMEYIDGDDLGALLTRSGHARRIAGLRRVADRARMARWPFRQWLRGGGESA